MALVLVEGEDQIPGLIGASVNTTAQQGPEASSTATGFGLALAAAEHGIYAITAVLSALFIFT